MKRLLPCLPLLVAACTASFGRPESCGEFPEQGGPARIVTREQELCQIVQARVQRELEGRSELDSYEFDRLMEQSLQWEHMGTVEALVARIRKDAGDAFADEVQRAVDSVTARSVRPMGTDCGDTQRCLVKGAAKGARIALLSARR